MATSMETRRMFRQADARRRAELETINGGPIRHGDWFAKPYAADQVEIAIQGADGFPSGTVLRVSAGDADLEGLAVAAEAAELPALRRLLNSIERDLTEGELNPDELLATVQTIKTRIERRAVGLVEHAGGRRSSPELARLAPLDPRD